MDLFILLREILIKLGLVLAPLIIIYFAVNYIRILFFEYKLYKLKQHREREVKKIKTEPVVMVIIERRIKYLDEKLRPQLEDLEMRRRFLLERLPFLRR